MSSLFTVFLLSLVPEERTLSVHRRYECHCGHLARTELKEGRVAYHEATQVLCGIPDRARVLLLCHLSVEAVNT